MDDLILAYLQNSLTADDAARLEAWRRASASNEAHFNDFVQMVQLRGAVYRALQKANLQHEDVAQRVVESLGLRFEDYAANPEAVATELAAAAGAVDPGAKNTPRTCGRSARRSRIRT